MQACDLVLSVLQWHAPHTLTTTHTPTATAAAPLMLYQVVQSTGQLASWMLLHTPAK